MRQHVYGSFALLMMLSGCGTMNVSAPNLHTVSIHRTGYSDGSSPMPGVSSAETGVRVLPTSHASSTPVAPVFSAAPMEDASPTATAASATATSTASAGTPTTFGLATADADTIHLIPIEDDNGNVTSLMTVPQSGLVTWAAKASTTGAPVTIASVRLTLQSIASYPAPTLPSPAASQTATASDAATVTASNATSTAAGNVPQTGLAVTLTLAPSDLNCSPNVAPGSTLSLTLSLQDAKLLKFMAANANSSEVAVTITPLDSKGNPLQAQNGRPFAVQQNIQVL